MAYLAWVRDTEGLLRSLYRDPACTTMLQTPRHWHIQSWTVLGPEMVGVIQAEIDQQIDAIRSLESDLRARRALLSDAPGRLAVLDTHVLLHYRALDGIDWAEVLKPPPVRLVVPLRVVEELDAKKFARRRGDLIDRARRRIGRLEKLLGPGSHGPAPLREGLTVEVPLEGERRRERSADADGEILDVCQTLQQFIGRSVTLVTSDMAMRIRAASRGIEVVPIADEYLEGQ